jgi:hypothetical protein
MLGGGGTGTTPRNYIGRLNPDGSLDTSFDPGANGSVGAIALQPDGKILVGGDFTTLGGGGTGTTPRKYIGRLNPDGSLDTSFNPGADGYVHALALQSGGSDGKILVGGDFTTLGGGGTGAITRNHIARLTKATQPGTATLISPSGTISTYTPTYTWNAVASVPWYNLWVSDSTTSVKIATWYTAAQAGCASATGTCSVTPSTSLAAGSATWWIQTWNEAGYGPWSSGMPFNVSIGGAPPPAATLISPSGTISINAPTYTWNAATSSTWYYLWVNDSTTSAKIQTWYTAAQAGCASGTGICAVTPSTTLGVGSATWWIQTWNSTGYGPWSSPMPFSIRASPPPAATLIAPSGTISTNAPTYTWNAVGSATSYYLWVNDSTTPTKIQTWYTAAQAGCTSGSGTCSVTPSTTLGVGLGTWWIQTRNEAGYGPWSSGMPFNVSIGGSPPPAATLISPSGTISTSTPTYTWNAVSNSTWYYLWVNDSATSAKIQTWYTAAQAGCPSGTGTCSVTPSTTLASGSATWWIQTWNSFGYGPWSSGMSFAF